MPKSSNAGRPPSPGLNGFYLPANLLKNLGVDVETSREIIRSRLMKASELFCQMQKNIK